MAMSQHCPRCRLISTPTALRCDCGYDFTLHKMQESYLDRHLIEKHGEATILRLAAHDNLLCGLVLLIGAGAGFMGSGSPLIPVVLCVGGTVLVFRGLRRRALARTLDRLAIDRKRQYLKR